MDQKIDQEYAEVTESIVKEFTRKRETARKVLNSMRPKAQKINKAVPSM